MFQVLFMPHSSSLRRFLRKIRLWCFVFSPFRPAADALPRHGTSKSCESDTWRCDSAVLVVDCWCAVPGGSWGICRTHDTWSRGRNKQGSKPQTVSGSLENCDTGELKIYSTFGCISCNHGHKHSYHFCVVIISHFAPHQPTSANKKARDLRIIGAMACSRLWPISWSRGSSEACSKSVGRQLGLKSSHVGSRALPGILVNKIAGRWTFIWATPIPWGSVSGQQVMVQDRLWNQFRCAGL